MLEGIRNKAVALACAVGIYLAFKMAIGAGKTAYFVATEDDSFRYEWVINESEELYFSAYLDPFPVKTGEKTFLSAYWDTGVVQYRFGVAADSLGAWRTMTLKTEEDEDGATTYHQAEISFPAGHNRVEFQIDLPTGGTRQLSGWTIEVKD